MIDYALLGFEFDTKDVIVATTDLGKVERAAKKAETASERLTKQATLMGRRLQTAGRQMSSVGRGLSLFVTAPMIAAGFAAIKLAVEAEETANKFDVVFRGSVERSEKALADLVKVVPLTITEMKGLAAGVQDMLVPMGLLREEAADLSVQAVELAGDLASFNNVGADQVLRDIGSALAGQSEPLRKYGVDTRVTRLETLALAEGLIEVGESLDNASTAQAVFLAIMRDSEDAMGDAARTVESSANQTRFLARDFKQLREEVGRDLIPVYRDLLKELKGGLAVLQDMSPEARMLTIRIAGLVAAVGPLLIVLGSTARLLGTVIPLIISLSVAIWTRLIPALGRLALMLGPAGAVAIGLGILIKLIGDAYVAKLRAAIIETDRFTTSLEDLKSVAGLQSNLDAVNKELDRHIAERERLTNNMIALEELMQNASATQQPGALESMQNELARLQIEIQNTDRFIENHIKLRDSYIQKIREATEAVKDEGDALDSLNQSPGLEWLPEDTVALEGLIDVIDPATREIEELEAALALLEKALKTEEIKLPEYQRLVKLLRQSAIASDVFNRTLAKRKQVSPSVLIELEANIEYIEQLEQMRDQVEQLDRQFDPLLGGMRDLADARELVNKAFAEGAIDPETFDRVTAGIDKATIALQNMDDTFVRAVNEWIFALHDVAGLFEQDSAEAEALNTVLQALNIVLGIQAVLKALNAGDPYTAIPRAIAVAAMVASMGVQTGAAGSSSTKSLQESQGTGSVLGAVDEKTESILNAMEITANATSELVGINRGMLHALQSLRDGLSGAVVQIARGGAGTDIALPDVSNKFVDLLAGIFDIVGLGDFFNKIFGGKVKLVDEGLQIEGGALTQLMNDVVVQAFQEANVKKHFLDDYDLETRFEEVDDAIGRQLSLVFQSIGETVRQAALALGIPLDTIEERIKAFEVETLKISFKDLSAEEQREELAAVFGKIFDDLASHVIPFIDEFQKVGEGLGETLVRVATSVQVMQEAVKALGFAADASDPEAFAHMAVGLVELTGGVEEFISQFTTFFDRFANEQQKLDFVTSQIERAFEGVGLSIPPTRDGMVDLMRSLDASTEAGQRQIAMLLQIADVADEYYSLIEKAEEDRFERAQTLFNQRQILSEFTGDTVFRGLIELRDSFLQALEAADALGASQKEYAMIARSFNNQLRRMAAELTLSVITMSEQLFGQQMDGIDDAISDGLSGTREVANRVFTEWQRALEDIFDFTQSILLDEQLTTLTPAEQLAEAQSQFDKLLASAVSGDVEAAAALPDAAKALLEEARFMFASGAQYTAIFNEVTQALSQLEMPDIPETIIEVDTSTTGPMQDPEISALVRELERFLLATDLAGTLRDLSQVLNVSVITLAEELKIPLNELVSILGLELGALSEATAGSLAEVATLLGADVFELMDALEIGLHELVAASDINLNDLSQTLTQDLGNLATTLGANILELLDKLGVPIADLAKTFGIGIAQFSAEQFQALVQFSNALGAGIDDVARALSINLGKIEDANSLLSEALDIAISGLPEAIQADLGPLLEAIRMATEGADATNAIQNLGDFILALPDDIGSILIPFLDLIGFEVIAPELAALFDIEQNTADIVAGIHALIETMGGTAPVAQESTITEPKLSETSTGPVEEEPISGTVVIEEPIITDPVLEDPILTEPVEEEPVTSDPVLEEPTLTEPVEEEPVLTVESDPVLDEFAHGGSVDQTGKYQLHAGEFVVTKDANNLNISTNGESLSPEELTQIRNILMDIREENKRYHEKDLVTSRDIESNLKQQAEQSRRLANG